MIFRYIVEWTDANANEKVWNVWSHLNKDGGKFFDLQDARTTIIDLYRQVSSKVQLDEKDPFLYHRIDAHKYKDGCIIRIREIIPEIDWTIGITDLLLNK